MRNTILAVVLLLLSHAWLFSQNIDMDLVEARDEFRWGVIAYHSGYFDKAVLSFERSFSLKPENITTQFWLGETYRRLGYEETALKIWNGIEEAGQADPLLINRIDTLNFKRGLGRELSEPGKYVPSYVIKGSFDTYSLFERPASVAVLDDGSYFLTSFTTNEVLHMNANGGIKERIQGGLSGLDHPFGITQAGGFLYVTEFQGDRIVRMDLLGGSIERFGGPGSGDGKLAGPQFITVDEAGYMYVTEIGNRRVSKFDTAGSFLFSFGKRTQNFGGLKSPSGIISHDGSVFVSDNREGCLYVFDSSGNYLYTLGEGILSHPEGLSTFDDHSLLIADTSRIYQLDVTTRKFSVLYEFDTKGQAEVRVLDAAVDANQNLMAVDFNGNLVHFFTEVNEFYSGLDVDIVSVKTNDFPKVQILVNVSNRMGEPFTGLERENFLITEAGYGLTEYELPYSGQNRKDAGYSLVLEKSEGISGYLDESKEAIDILTGAFGKTARSSFVTASEEAVLASDGNVTAATYSKAVYDKSGVARKWDVDNSIFMAASRLVNQPIKKAVVLVTSGILPPDSFDDHSLLQLGNFLTNNGITFSVVYVRKTDTPPMELEYLVGKTGGKSRYLYDPEGIKGIAKTLYASRDGMYVLEYTSGADTDFGSKYISLEIEASLFSRTGRDEKGYFAPAF